MRCRIRTTRAVAATGLMAAVLATLASNVARGDVQPHVGSGAPLLMPQPASNLADGQFVKLTFSGFAPQIGIAFRECVASPTAVATDCTPQNTQVTGVTDDLGGGATYLPVHAGKLLSANGTGSITCDASHACVIAAMPSPSDLTTAVFAPVTFARSKDDCPSPGADGVLGIGSSSAYRAVYGWESAVCVPPQSLAVGYTVSNSPDGISNFYNGLTDFAVSGPLPQIPAPPAGVTYRMAPLTSSAVVLAYRIYDLAGPQITSLTLTPDLIARILLGRIPNWAANADIKALNQGVLFPGRIVPFVRAEHSAQTYALTSWLAATAPTTWTAGATDIFPIAPSGVQGVTGSDALGLQVAAPTTDFFDQGNFGFMDSSTAAFYGLPTVRIRKADGSVVSATPDAIQQAIADATVQPDGTLGLNYTDTNPRAYPMPMVTYMLAPTSIAPGRGATVAGFLRYAVQDGQGNLPDGYTPLAPSLVTESLQVASVIPATPRPTPTPAPSLSPTVAATPTPAATAAPSSASVSIGASDLGGTLQLPFGGSAAFTHLPPLPAQQPALLPAPATPTPCTSPAASVPARTASATPNATPTPPSAAAAPSTSPCPGAHVAAAIVPSGHAPAELQYVQLGDWTGTRYVLPSIALLGLLGLAGGIAVEVLARRRRLGLALADTADPATADATDR